MVILVRSEEQGVTVSDKAAKNVNFCGLNHNESFGLYFFNNMSDR